MTTLEQYENGAIVLVARDAKGKVLSRELVVRTVYEDEVMSAAIYRAVADELRARGKTFEEAR